MQQGLKMVIGMTLAYVTSFAGLVLAWRSYRRHRGGKAGSEDSGAGVKRTGEAGNRDSKTERSGEVD